MKKLICIVLVVMMFALCFAACGGNSDTNGSRSEAGTEQTSRTNDTSSGNVGGESADESVPGGIESAAEPASEETSQDESKKWLDADGNYAVPGDPIDVVATFGSQFSEFHVLVKGTDNGTYQSDDFTTGSELYGDTLDQAVTERNNYIHDHFGVTIVAHKDNGINNLIREDLASGEQYDIVMPNVTFLATLASEGQLIDLYTLENINIDAPWFDQNANETFSMNHQLFFTTGDITILNKVCTTSILFGKEILSKYEDLESPYQLVRDNQWTYDKMKEMAKLVTADTDGEPGMTVDDTWGFLTSYGDAVNLYAGAGMHLCDKDSNDYPYFSLGQEERAQTILQQILKDMAEPGWCVYAQEFPSDIWVTSLDAIEDGRILFRPSAFSAMTKLRKRGVDFGIVPLPKWNEDQDNYYGFCGVGQTAGFGILVSCRNPEYSAYMADIISAASKNYVTRAYMEVNVKGKDLQSEEDLEMLEIIFDNIVYDIGDVNNFGSINSLIAGLVQQKSTDLSSMIDQNRDKIESAIDDVIAAYEAME